MTIYFSHQDPIINSHLQRLLLPIPAASIVAMLPICLHFDGQVPLFKLQHQDSIIPRNREPNLNCNILHQFH